MQTTRGFARTPKKLSESLLHHIDLYALAASAAGVSLLALTSPAAEAKIVYTKAHQVIGANGIYDLDLNHDGIVDFVIRQWRAWSYSNVLLARGALGNAIAGTGNSVGALPAGANIGPRRHFASGKYPGLTMFRYYDRCDYTCVKGSYGKWIDVNNRYLGLKFKIKDKTHYGWARLSVQNLGFDITATLTGYAYETVPDHSLRAGQTEDDAANVPDRNEFSLPRNAPLGRLALGAQGVPSGRQP